MLLGPLRRFHLSESQTLVVSGIVVGAGAALGGIGFRYLLDTCTYLFFDVLGPALDAALGSPGVILIPALGGLFVGLITYFFARGAMGPGVPEVMAAVVRSGGRMRPRRHLARIVCAALCIGSGGSLGRHGPTVRLGAVIGSLVGQLLKMSDNRIRTLVGCGAAGGIAATFNAPIAGVFYALEVILGEFTTRAFGVVVIASVTAAAIGRGVFGDAPAFSVPPYELAHPGEFALYALLGVLAAFTGVGLTRLMYWFQDIFSALPIPQYLMPVCGGLLLGVLGLFLPQIIGIGYPVIDQALGAGYPLLLLLALIGAKVLAVSLSIGSRGAGGIFAPTLFIGGLLGTALGAAAQAALPEGMTAPPGAYALVGMGAVFAGAVRAPITAVLILFELTGDYAIILPLMLAVVISTQVAEALSGDTIYTLKLRRRGVDIRAGRDADLLRTLPVADAMTEGVILAPGDLTMREAAEHLLHERVQSLVVVDEAGVLWGIVTEDDLRRALQDQQEGAALAEIASRPVLTVFPDENLNDAIQRMGVRDLGQVPVVSRDDPTEVIGLLRRADIFHAYSRAMLGRVGQ